MTPPPQTEILHLDNCTKLMQNSFNFQQEDYKRLQKKILWLQDFGFCRRYYYYKVLYFITGKF